MIGFFLPLFTTDHYFHSSKKICTSTCSLFQQHKLIYFMNFFPSFHVLQQGNTALHEAAWKGFSQTIEVLMKHKANAYIKNKVRQEKESEEEGVNSKSICDENEMRMVQGMFEMNE